MVMLPVIILLMALGYMIFLYGSVPTVVIVLVIIACCTEVFHLMLEGLVERIGDRVVELAAQKEIEKIYQEQGGNGGNKPPTMLL